MKYHSDTLVPHKSAIMRTPANVLAEDICLPAAVLKQSALRNNIDWMQRYADARGVSLAPHGKPTMTLWIFQAQQQAGAWAIGVGRAWQAGAAMRYQARADGEPAGGEGQHAADRSAQAALP